MSTAMRVKFLALGLAAAVLTGCDKSAATPAAGTTTSGAPGNPVDAGAAKKLVGVWESVEDAKKGGLDEKVTVEFKKDGGLSFVMGPIELTGTWKVAKDEGKTMTIDAEMTMKGPGDPGKSTQKTFKIDFEAGDTMTMSPTDKPDPKKFKRKT
jgi:hypothetical protein